jgi:hypothetical protein
MIATITAPVMGVMIFLTILSGAGLGMLLGRLLPAHHLSDQSRSVITVATAVVGTASALVLGLLISTASSAFTQRSGEVGRIAVDIIRVDRLLRNYGPEADGARQSLTRYAAIEREDLFPEESNKAAKVDKPGAVQLLDDIRLALFLLQPSDDSQRPIKDKALQLLDEMADTRWLLAFQQNISPIPPAFLIMLVFWLTILFGTFGLFAPRNITVAVALVLSAVAVSGGIELVLDMTDPFSGIVRISSTPMRHALEMTRHNDPTP